MYITNKTQYYIKEGGNYRPLNYSLTIYSSVLTLSVDETSVSEEINAAMF